MKEYYKTYEDAPKLNQQPIHSVPVPAVTEKKMVKEPAGLKKMDLQKVKSTAGKVLGIKNENLLLAAVLVLLLSEEKPDMIMILAISFLLLG